jgi:hypothetical protein
MTTHTKTITTTAAPSTSSLATSTKFKTFAVTFAVVGPILYLICVSVNLPLVTYHAAMNRIDLGWTPPRR